MAHRARLIVQAVLPGLLDRMGDPKERVHAPALESVQSLGSLVLSSSESNGDTENAKEPTVEIYQRLVLAVMESPKQSARSKRSCLELVTFLRNLSTPTVFPLRPLIPVLVKYLEDTDAGVR